ncbi:hypothetical protein EMGBS10_10590 [Opitutia bacterium]|jgi:hypothetical protein|nr:hypothetical protein EMGBS10_10590 [Opitutae bacterium]
MSRPDPAPRLRRLVPLLAGAVALLAGLFAYVLVTGRAPALWPLLLGDLLFTGVLVFALWRLLGRR